MGNALLRRIIKTGGEQGYARVKGVPIGEKIIANAQDIEQDGVTYKPFFYICAMDTVTGATFSKTGTGISTGADAYVFSDEPSTLYVGTSVSHTFDSTKEYATDENWKCRYVIFYATAANFADTNGITINLHDYRATFEMIAKTGLIISAESAISGSPGFTSNGNLRYVNIENANFYNNTISVSAFCAGSMSLQTIKLPASLSAISGSYAFLSDNSLSDIDLKFISTINSSEFCNGTPLLKSANLSSITSLENASAMFIPYACYINLPSNFDIDGANFTGAAGYTKSFEWLNEELPTKLKDNSGGTAKTMTLGASNSALIGTSAAATIAAKNWTIN